MTLRQLTLTFLLTPLVLAGFLLIEVASGQELVTNNPPAQSMSKAQAPPAITSEMREAYQQARADVAEAQIALTAAQSRLESAVKAMQAVCPLTLDQQTGKVQCAVKVEAKPEAKP